MTATIKPPDREVKSRPIRFSAMESLGFSNPSSVWTDAPSIDDDVAVAASPEPDTVADWQPGDFEDQLTGRDLRWGLLLTSVLILLGIGAAGFWLYQRPSAEAAASTRAVLQSAEQLESSLGGLETFNADLTNTDEESDTSLLFVADAAARALFEVSGDLPASESDRRSSAAAASSATLDGVRLAEDAYAYRLAVYSMLVAPELETDHNLIELDEAARSFGDWQLRFDDVRTVLPDGVLPEVTEQLDVLSGDLTAMLGDYVAALRVDDSGAATTVLNTLSTRLQDVRDELEAATVETQARVEQRLSETRAALGALRDGPRP
jgi:hypothetical protein